MFDLVTLGLSCWQHATIITAGIIFRGAMLQ